MSTIKTYVGRDDVGAGQSLVTLELFIGDMDSAELADDSAIDVSDAVTAVNGLIHSLESRDAEIERLQAERDELVTKLAVSEKSRWLAVREIERLRAAMNDTCDLLAERTHASPARSAGHNARLRLEAALEQNAARSLAAPTTPLDGRE
jgi:hypothetical protein